MKKLLGVLLVLFVFVYSYSATSWTASYMPFETSWRSDMVFTPSHVTDPGQIYTIDKYIYAFKYDPTTSFLFVLSLSVIIVFIIFGLRNLFGVNRSISN